METLISYLDVLYDLHNTINSARYKGVVGELIINISNKLIKLTNRNKYITIEDVFIPSSYGTTQIDHIIISEYGMFVIETKNISGWIFGSPDKKLWTQKLNKNCAYKFYNPLWQNYKHTKALADLTGVNHDLIKSVVVFVGKTKFKTSMPDNVLKLDQYISYIINQQITVFTKEEKKRIHQIILDNKLDNNWETARQHVKHLKQHHKTSSN